MFLIEKQALLQHVLAFREDCAGELSCKDTLNFWKWLCDCFLFHLKTASASRVHTWNKTSSKATDSEMQDIASEPSLMVGLCNKPVIVQRKKTNLLLILETCNFTSLLARPFTQKNCHSTKAEFCQDPCTNLMQEYFLFCFPN